MLNYSNFWIQIWNGCLNVHPSLCLVSSCLVWFLILHSSTDRALARVPRAAWHDRAEGEIEARANRAVQHARASLSYVAVANCANLGVNLALFG